MMKKLIMLLIAATAAIGAWADFVCSAEVGEVDSATGKREGTVTWKNTGSSRTPNPTSYELFLRSGVFLQFLFYFNFIILSTLT